VRVPLSCHRRDRFHPQDCHAVGDFCMSGGVARTVGDSTTEAESGTVAHCWSRQDTRNICASVSLSRTSANPPVTTYLRMANVNCGDSYHSGLGWHCSTLLGQARYYGTDVPQCDCCRLTRNIHSYNPSAKANVLHNMYTGFPCRRTTSLTTWGAREEATKPRNSAWRHQCRSRSPTNWRRGNEAICVVGDRGRGHRRLRSEAGGRAGRLESLWTGRATGASRNGGARRPCWA
jgi:hypothetical protein